MPEFTDYERIADTLMFFNSNITLEFVTQLARKNKFGQRQFFSLETEYNSETYNGSPVRSIRRSMSYYFVISVKDNFGGGIVIRQQDKELLTIFLEQKVIPWIIQNSVFHLVKGGILALKEFEPVTYAQSETKYITFEPIIMTDEEGKQSAGIRMNLNGSDVVDLNADKFMGFYSIIKHTDMYLASCAQANYTKMAPYGVNQYKPTGLGASREPSNDAWSSANYKGRGYNAFLDSK